MPEVHVFSSITALPGREDELRALCKQLVADTGTEPGAQAYSLFEDIKRPGKFYFFQTYANDAAVEAHVSSAHYQSAAARFSAMITAAPDYSFTKLIGKI